ncbi:helix-turn-helix domain-containing protein [Sporosarcina sp. FSL W7-1349]|uniref:helix-turn-helix transcriptional regulator n=1 Tax=Sporosarcina sp. FSL W7-1349 TaxID=2921561 RepID=UPI0030F5F863
MIKEEIIHIVSEQMKLIRTEQGHTQQRMADLLGISKKTLLQIEKGRVQAGWTVVLAVCGLFRESVSLQSALGEDPLETVELVLYERIRPAGRKTMGGRIWWRDIENWKDYRLQQNVVSQHYRIIDPDDYRIFSTFDWEEVKKEMKRTMDSSEDLQRKWM